MKFIYRNKATGAVISVPCALEGADWEQVQDRAETPTEAVKTPTEATKKPARKKAVKEA